MRFNGHASCKHEPSRLDLTLSEVRLKFFKHGGVGANGDAVASGNPLDDLCAKEEAAELELQLALVEETARAWEIAFKAYEVYHTGFMQWLFDDGADPREVVKRLFLYARKKNKKLIWNMNFRDLGALFGESHGTMHASSTAMFGEVATGVEKGESARKNMALAQQKNGNRKGGKRNAPWQSSFLSRLKITPPSTQTSFLRKLKTPAHRAVATTQKS